MFSWEESYGIGLKSKIKNLSSASISGMILYSLMGALLKDCEKLLKFHVQKDNIPTVLVRKTGSRKSHVLKYRSHIH